MKKKSIFFLLGSISLSLIFTLCNKKGTEPEEKLAVPTLVAHWKFDETTGLTASDELGASSGTLVNIRYQ